MIKIIKGKYEVISKKTGRHLGVFDTLEEAKQRIREVEYFKHRGKK